jgi:hypothetical protein
MKKPVLLVLDADKLRKMRMDELEASWAVFIRAYVSSRFQAFILLLKKSQFFY